ncbi:multidrug transporter AcrB [Alteromonas australica]|jgi:hydrophobe/amphiphile efflux-1 (HAE1) family protein|uniref:AcrB/AcrD/AcrF family protein n=1 Tax=Alteromonas australica TaxID=589873 RepID=A0A075P0K0_9ALTE|nr:efflux RND transporter permease subunit [Alteromonas australica]MAF71531.1 AcrB/AcrD/AcrF family protein [Alteromonas sp.]AIF98385.1 multidrug transporter AcrB [Alteromonas australica]AJP43372.1 multidrug transporter AcrB [Alteromonas australica]MAO31004.1 AcrB/AcrD/AcrF family protein [Alteromonas sp.]MBU35079.1 AcrB/AcrD/AcrF family protein [Alteromonas sp.]|tara:strand:- start:174 stop:3278 length:3105 start_codon:yes stop_codon:yes gene_type:complete
MSKAPMTNDLPSLSIRRPVLIVVLNLLIAIAGLAALSGLEVRELPDVDTPTVTVTASYPGASPETVDAEVTSRLEGAVARVSGVKNIYAQSEENSARVRVEFRPGINLEDAANETRESVSRVQRQLPEDVEQVSIIRADNDAQAVVSLAISSNTLDMETLTERVDTDVAPLFLSIPGVADVSLSGDRARVLRVSVDPLRLTSFGLSMTDIADALVLAPFDVPAGSIQSADQALIVRADATSVSAQDVGDIVVSGDIRINDVASVYFGPADSSSVVRLDGQPVIGVGVIRQASSNTIEISDEVLAMVADLDKRFTDMDIVVTADDAEFIRDSVKEVVVSLSLTVALVVVTLLVFIGSWRATIVPALSIPVSLAGALGIIWAMGFSINILTLLALVLATGMIVDDAIVVSENIQRRRGMGLGARAAAVVGTREVFFAVIATTAVLASVFIPIAFLPSTAGRLFREFGGVLAGAVIISSFVALSLVPALTARLAVKKQKQSGFFHATFGRFGHACLRVYQYTLVKALKYAWLVGVLSLLAGGGAYLLAKNIDNELLPSEDRGTIRIFARGPDGAGLNFMDRQAEKMEEMLLPYVENGTIDSIYTVVGRWDPNIVFITAPLQHWDDRDKSLQDVVSEIRPGLQNIPGAPGNAFGGNSLNLRGQGGGLEIALTGDTYDNIHKAAMAFAATLESELPELGRPRVSYDPTQPQMRVNIDRRRAEELGVPLSDIASTLTAAVNGDDIADLNVGDQAIPIMLQTNNRSTVNPSDLTNLYVKSNDGNLIPLSSLAYITEEGVAAELERQAQRRAIKVEMELPEDIPLSEVVENVRTLAQQNLPDGIGLVFLGEAQTYEETSQQVALTYVLAFVIVLLVLAAQFESVNSAVVVMLTVPFGIAAAIYALYLTSTSINIYSQIGLVMLIGLLAKNAILLIEFADQLRDKGLSVYDAIVEAGKVRLRPIMMTLVSTILGGLPLILSTGAGAEARNAIGWVVFGGLGIAVVFTLYLTPVLYLALARFTKPRADETDRLEREMEAAGEHV